MGSASVSDDYVTAALTLMGRVALARGELEIRRILVSRHRHRRSPSAPICLCFQRWITRRDSILWRESCCWWWSPPR
jgi:hypothetical protein